MLLLLQLLHRGSCAVHCTCLVLVCVRVLAALRLVCPSKLCLLLVGSFRWCGVCCTLGFKP